jgi:hypothetical protein
LKCSAGEGWRRSVGSMVWERNYYLRVKEDKNILCMITRRKVSWNGYTSRRNCPLKHVNEAEIEGRAQVTGRRGRRCKPLPVNRRGRWSYRKLKYEATDRTLRRTRFGRGNGPVARRTTEWLWPMSLKAIYQTSGWRWYLRFRKVLDPDLRLQTGCPGSVLGGEDVCPVPPGKCRNNASSKATAPSTLYPSN